MIIIIVLLLVSLLSFCFFCAYTRWAAGQADHLHHNFQATGCSVDCVVCLNRISPVEKVRFLPRCNHCFHLGCIDAWLQFRSTCPLCRIEVSLLSRPPPHHGLFSCFEDVRKWVEIYLDFEIVSLVCDSLGYC